MKIEQQVCAREYSEKLEKLGVPQRSVWYWMIFPDNQTILISELEALKHKVNVEYAKECFTNEYERIYGEETKFYSAFTVAELGKRLSRYKDRVFCTWKGVVNWHCFDINDRSFMQEATTEANARAKMKIYLLENKL